MNLIDSLQTVHLYLPLHSALRSLFEVQDIVHHSTYCSLLRCSITIGSALSTTAFVLQIAVTITLALLLVSTCYHARRLQPPQPDIELGTTTPRV